MSGGRVQDLDSEKVNPAINRLNLNLRLGVRVSGVRICVVHRGLVDRRAACDRPMGSI